MLKCYTFILICEEDLFGNNLVKNRKLTAERDEYDELCVELYRRPVIYSTGNSELCVQLTGVFLQTAQAIGNFMYSCTGVLLYIAQGLGNFV
jgi:hypothetical protein